ncbi:membrane protein insertase YidC [Dactylosporangium sp. NPDC005572]|uniref:YidC/Oxa1 family membrane protein insertase n=1 Tax=Dactylosporangium sp. NPDC005572 TaxID=3156889 RepID=UPI0033ADA8D1
MLSWFAGGLGSMPAAIVVATVLLRVAMLPLSLRAYRAENVRSRLTPQLQALRERHGSEPVVLAEKSAELMRKEGTSPFAGLVPMLLQAPFVWLLYREFTGGRLQGYDFLGSDLSHRLLTEPGMLAGWLVIAALVAVAVWNGRQLPAQTPSFVKALQFGTVAFAPFVPLAAGIYLVTTSAWTAAERWVVRAHFRSSEQK